MDSLASLALATEEPKEDLLHRPPYRKKEYIISQKMVKHILGQSFFQAIILFVFVFGGRYFLPDECDPYTGLLQNTHPIAEIKDAAPKFDFAGLSVKDSEASTYMDMFGITVADAKDRMSECQPFVLDGSVQSVGGDDMYRHFETVSPSRHLSFIFNLFVFLQIFNMLGARKINDEKNIFEGICKNPLFLGVWFTIFFGQILIVIFGGRGMGVHLMGLTLVQWVVSVGLSFLAIIWNLVLKFVPEKFFPEMGDENASDVKSAQQDYANLLKFRKTKELSGSMRQGNWIKNKEGGSFK